MGFSVVAASAIILIITLITVAILGSILFTIMMNITKELVKRNVVQEEITFKITSLAYNSTGNVLHINITNTGQHSIIPYTKSELILDYIDVTNTHRVDVLKYKQWIPYRLFVGNSSYIIPSNTFVEIPPGAICEIIAYPNYVIDTAYPVITVFVLDSGAKSELITKIVRLL